MQCVKGRVFGEPLAGDCVIEPKVQDRFGIDLHGLGTARLSPSSIPPSRTAGTLPISSFEIFRFRRVEAAQSIFGELNWNRDGNQ
jgi:hypothetical protein